jgi:hypothetical protein
MLSFKTYNKLDTIIEQLNMDYLTESSPEKGKVSNNTKGVLHEILVGKHLNNGKHMSLHPNENKETPQEAHDRLAATIHLDDYEEMNAKAKSAAEHIKDHLHKSGHSVHEVKWTSKPGDTEKVTGVKASQKEDSSDLYITTKHKSGKIVHHGVSLKVGSAKNIPASSLGIESSGPKAKEIFNDHRKHILSTHTELSKLKNKPDRKQWMKDNPNHAAEIKKKNLTTLTQVAKSLAEHLISQQKSGNHKAIIDHIRAVLHAHETPAQKLGNKFIKHTTYDSAAGAKHHISNPGLDYEHHFEEPKNIHIEHRGTSVVFKNKKTNQKIATHSMKFDSQSDPLSALKSAGHPGH